MGVALNANDVMPFSGTKKKLVNKLKRQNEVPIKELIPTKVSKPEVVTKLVAEANVPAKQTFRFTPTQVQLITYMMDKHGMDYKAMARDPKNHYQETPAKLKGMVTKFISIPEHYAPYCKERGLITPSEDKKEISEEEVDNEDDMDDEAENLESDDSDEESDDSDEEIDE